MKNMEIKVLTFIVIFSIMDIRGIINETCLQLEEKRFYARVKIFLKVLQGDALWTGKSSV